MFSELFPTKVRYSGASLVYQIAMEHAVENELSKRRAPLLRGPCCLSTGVAAPPSKAAL